MLPACPEKKIEIWLWCLTFLVFCMVTLGGATRLTDSGLSITEWQPILGAIPPLNPQDWQDAFVKYQQIPEFKLVNPSMTLSEFQWIYWWEWSHRFLGRFLGVVFLVPLLFFWLRQDFQDFALKKRLAFLFFLLGSQGVLGWYMVQSGLETRVDVSQYRLAAHLTLACFLFACLLWTLLDLRRFSNAFTHRPLPARTQQTRWAFAMVCLIFLQITAGAFVAGLDAGMGYNTWPLMDNAIIPIGLFAASPWWTNIFENALTVQFQHRLLAYLLFMFAALYIFKFSRERISFAAVLIVLIAQIIFGILTLLFQVPISLALIHQGGALLLLAACLIHLHRLRYASHPLHKELTL